jgi:hypothetical protein
MGRDDSKITPKLTEAQQALVNQWATHVKDWLAREAAAPEKERQRRIIVAKAQQALVNQWATHVKQWLAREAAAAPERERQRRVIARYIAVRDNQKRPNWMKADASPTPQSKPGRRLRWKEVQVLPILCKYWKPDGRPTQPISRTEINRVIRKVQDDYAKLYKGDSVGAKTVKRAAGLLPRQ